MKDGIKEIIGKTISGIVVKDCGRPPRSQVHLIFDDCTYFELYTSDTETIKGAGGVDRGDINRVIELHPEAENILVASHKVDLDPEK